MYNFVSHEIILTLKTRLYMMSICHVLTKDSYYWWLICPFTFWDIFMLQSFTNLPKVQWLIIALSMRAERFACLQSRAMSVVAQLPVRSPMHGRQSIRNTDNWCALFLSETFWQTSTNLPRGHRLIIAHFVGAGKFACLQSRDMLVVAQLPVGSPMQRRQRIHTTDNWYALFLETHLSLQSFTNVPRGTSP